MFRFMCVHLKEIQDAVKKHPDREWSVTIDKIENQLLLRALSCVQLANKMTHNKTVTPSFLLTKNIEKCCKCLILFLFSRERQSNAPR